MGLGLPFRGSTVRLRLTRAGWLFLVISVVVCFAAVQSQAAMLFVLFGVMVGAMAVSAVAARRAMAGVAVRRDVPAQAWQNQTVHLGYYLRNTRRRGSCLALTMEERPTEGLESVRGYCTHLPAGRAFRSGARFIVRRRGRITLEGVELKTAFPFGLIRACRFVPDTASLVIWPARGWIKKHILRRGAVETSAASPSQASGGQDEFFGLRDYRSDDNPRWIHWRRSANRPLPVVREMCQPLPEILWVVLDTRLSELSDVANHGRERLIRFAGTVVEHALSRGYQVGLTLAYSSRVASIPPAAGAGQLRALLDALADVDVNTRIGMDQTLKHMRPGKLRDAQVVVITPSPARVQPASAAPVRAHCRFFNIITDARLPYYFQDDPLAAREGN